MDLSAPSRKSFSDDLSEVILSALAPVPGTSAGPTTTRWPARG